MPTKKGRGIIYARPSFLEGMARIFDIGGTLNEYDFGPVGAESDAEALHSDWMAVGDDLRAAIGDYDPIAQDDSVWENSQSADAHWENMHITMETLKRYDAVEPGASERILDRWEKRSYHRMHAEKAALKRDSRRSATGLIFAFILSLLIISLGAYAVIWGNPWVGVAVIGINIAGLAGVFVYGTNSRRRERERKASEPRA